MARATAAIAVSVTLTAVGWLLADVAQTQGTSRAGRVEGMAAFERVARVLESPRCLNCHPRSDRPSQGDDRRAHLMNVQRGASDRGLPAMACAGCHQETNNDRAGVPGAPHWRLAPRSMGWTGLNRGEICRTLLDRSKNGGRSVAALVTHMTSDRLVLWAWQPGAGRTPPPLSIDQLKLALKAWVEAGTPCPR